MERAGDVERNQIPQMRKLQIKKVPFLSAKMCTERNFVICTAGKIILILIDKSSVDKGNVCYIIIMYKYA